MGTRLRAGVRRQEGGRTWSRNWRREIVIFSSELPNVYSPASLNCSSAPCSEARGLRTHCEARESCTQGHKARVGRAGLGSQRTHTIKRSIANWDIRG